MDGLDLIVDLLTLQLVGGGDLFLGGRLRPLGGDLLALQGAEPHARLVVQLLDGGCPIEEKIGVTAGEHLQRGVHPAVHVPHGGELRDGLLAARHRRLRPRGRLLGDAHFCVGVRELDLQAVVLLAERVDLVRQLGSLRDKVLE